MTTPITRFRKDLPLFERVAAYVKETSRHLTLQGVVPAARPYIAAGVARHLDAPVLVVTATSQEAETFWEGLSFFRNDDEPVFHFPAWEVIPFEPLSPSPEISTLRIATLAGVLREISPIVVAPLEAVLQFLIPRGTFASSWLELRRGETLNWSRLFRNFTLGGYVEVESVEVPGEYSRRGGILDFYPPALPSPVRIELFGDEIESLRLFDPETQRSEGDLTKVRVLPVRELHLDTQTLKSLKKHVPASAEAVGGVAEAALRIPGLEHYQALLSHSRQTLFDYFTSPPVVMVSEYGDLESRAEKFHRELEQEADRAVLPELFAPDKAYLDFAKWTTGLREIPTLYLDSFGLSPPESESLRVESSSGRNFVLSGRAEGSHESPLESTVNHIMDLQNRECIILVAGTKEGARRLGSLCSEHGLGTREVLPGDVPAVLTNPGAGTPLVSFGTVKEGFGFPETGVLLITEEDIFGAKVRRHVPRPSKTKGLMPDFHLLKPGDYIVHADHGIGVFAGVTRMRAGGEETDFLVLTYQGGDKVYVPAHGMNIVQRYVSWEGHRPRVDKLGGKMWPATKRKAKKALVTLARDLLRLYALRQATPGHAFSSDTPWQTEFEMAFEYVETEDQLQATEQIKADMEQPHPMDRLVCGDVGYGKTEVAMRAAFKAAMDSKQVALLAPTTILVQQHLATFRQRFAPYPVHCEMLSRFVKPSEQKKIVKKLSTGEVDIVIGTHRLLGKDVRFRDLGLVIVDEEQRFGVRHKEGLKELRQTVDVLSLTATPIPRTLYLSVSGIRELSQITTPPENRLAIKNTVTRFDADLIREAVLREIRRGGQVFFIHNRVRSIGGIGAYLQRLLPEIRIGIAHGQMSERQLEKVMSRFRAGEYDLLLSTTIVESGLDIPNANTMIVHRADTFGLSELYQLRGRIGRSRRRAYAYFLVRGGDALSPAARQRIEVIRDFSHLGAGFQIALYDLEIRGAGSVLGYRQSGHIAAVGFELYTRLLQETIRELQGEPVIEERPTKISLALPAFIPKKYVDSISRRLSFYKRIAGAASEQEVADVAGELKERFGRLPDAVQHLVWGAQLKLKGESMGVKSLEWLTGALEIAFYPQAKVAGDKLVAALKGAPPGSRMRGEHRLSWKWKADLPAGRFSEARSLLHSLS